MPASCEAIVLEYVYLQYLLPSLFFKCCDDDVGLLGGVGVNATVPVEGGGEGGLRFLLPRLSAPPERYC